MQVDWSQSGRLFGRGERQHPDARHPDGGEQRHGVVHSVGVRQRHLFGDSRGQLDPLRRVRRRRPNRPPFLPIRTKPPVDMRTRQLTVGRSLRLFTVAGTSATSGFRPKGLTRPRPALNTCRSVRHAPHTRPTHTPPTHTERHCSTQCTHALQHAAHTRIAAHAHTQAREAHTRTCARIAAHIQEAPASTRGCGLSLPIMTVVMLPAAGRSADLPAHTDAAPDASFDHLPAAQLLRIVLKRLLGAGHQEPFRLRYRLRRLGLGLLPRRRQDASGLE